MINCRNFFRYVLISLISLVLFASCYGSWNFWYSGNDVDKRTENLRYLTNDESAFAASEISDLHGEYTVLVISDSHFGSKRKKISGEPLFRYLDNLKAEHPELYPKFMLSLGDSVNIGYEDQYKEYLDFCNKLMEDYDIRLILNSCGNHDIYQSHWDNWEKFCYPHTSFYKFKTKDISWY